jgi:N-formylglutamate amidohydrolase
MVIKNFEIMLPGVGHLPLIGHVPHASTQIPPWLRNSIVLDDVELQSELIKLTDWHTQDLFSWILDLGGSMFVNQISRLAFDPERFADDEEEPMARVGQGAFYTHTSDGKLLAKISEAERADRLIKLYKPYHESLEKIVDLDLHKSGFALLLDCHSFATRPLLSEPNQAPDRPDICIGTDPFHTPETLSKGLYEAFRDRGFSVELDNPFSGSLVPLKFYGVDRRVTPVMIEVRRGLYCDERTGERIPDFFHLRDAIKDAVKSLMPGILYRV